MIHIKQTIKKNGDSKKLGAGWYIKHEMAEGNRAGVKSMIWKGKQLKMEVGTHLMSS